MKIDYLPTCVLKSPNTIPIMTSLVHNKFIMTMHQCTQPDFFFAKYPVPHLQEPPALPSQSERRFQQWKSKQKKGDYSIMKVRLVLD